MHVSDGFKLVAYSLAMSKACKTGVDQTIVPPGTNIRCYNRMLTCQDYYGDIAVYAYPHQLQNEGTGNNIKPVCNHQRWVLEANFYHYPDKPTELILACWIPKYSYPQPVTIRQVKKKAEQCYQSSALSSSKATMAMHFNAVDTFSHPCRLAGLGRSLYTRCKNIHFNIYRFVWNKDGTEPGSEDLDAAKWKPVLRGTGHLY